MLQITVSATWQVVLVIALAVGAPLTFLLRTGLPKRHAARRPPFEARICVPERDEHAVLAENQRQDDGR